MNAVILQYRRIFADIYPHIFSYFLSRANRPSKFDFGDMIQIADLAYRE